MIVTQIADALDHAMHQLAGLGVGDFAEAERVHRGDRARAHGEDVAHDAAHARRRALIGFDVGGVVVALHLEDDRQPLSGSLEVPAHSETLLSGAERTSSRFSSAPKRTLATMWI